MDRNLKVAAVAFVAVIVGIAALALSLTRVAAAPAPQVITKTITVPGPVQTKTVTRWKTRTITRTVYRNGYQYISQDPAWTCAGNWYNAYIRLASDPNYPAGDPGLWATYCPGVPQPAN